MIDYSARYDEDYFKRVAIAMKHHRRVNKGICCCCLVRQAKEMHHTSYGNDRLGFNWFPTCIKCHKKICHSPKNWVRLRGEKAVFGNHNIESFTRLLRDRYRGLSKTPKSS